jgi:uncharacterized protein with beta-barrel porin domain
MDRTSPSIMGMTPGRINRPLACGAVALSVVAARPGEAAVIEVGATDLADDAAKTVSFDQSFERTPLVFTMPTREGSGSRSVRASDVTADGFSITQAEPTGSGGGSATMTDVPYVAIEPGRHDLGGGVQIEAFNIRTTQTVSRGTGSLNNGGHETVALRQTFAATPAVLATIQTANNETNNPPDSPARPWITASVKDVQNDRFGIALERSEVDDGGAVTQAERVGYLAITVTSDTVTDEDGNAVAYDARRSANNIQGTDNGHTSVTFNQNFGQVPIALATKTTRDGGDGGWLRRGGVTVDDILLAVEEDQSNGAERNHTTERAAILAFARAFRAQLSTTSRAITWQGASATWDQDANWDNWDGDPFNLVSGDTLIFDDTGSAVTTTQIDAEHEGRLDELRFAGSTGYTLNTGASGKLHFRDGATIDNQSDQTQAIDAPLVGHGDALTLDTGATAGGQTILASNGSIDMVDGGMIEVIGSNALHVRGQMNGSIVNQSSIVSDGVLGGGDDAIVHQAGASFAPGPGIATATVQGNLRHAASSELILDIDAGAGAVSPGTSHDVVDVSGEAVLAAGSGMTLDVQQPNQLQEGDRFVVIDADGGVTDQGTQVDFTHSNGLGLRVAEDFQNGDSSLTLEATFDVFTPRASGANNLAVAGALGELAGSGPIAAVENELLDPLRNIAGDAAFNQALRELNATPYSALADLTFARTDNFLNMLGGQMLRRRTGGLGQASARGGTGRGVAGLAMLASAASEPRQLRQALTAADQRGAATQHAGAGHAASQPGALQRAARRPTYVFGDGFSLTERQQSRRQRPGYIARTRGGLVGFTERWDESLLGGFSLSVSQTDTHFSGRRGDTDTQTVRFGPHLSYERDDWFIDGALSYGYHRHDTTRRVPSLGSRLASEHDAHELASLLRGGVRWQVGRWQIMPMASLRGLYYHAESMRETGGPAALSLDDQDVFSLSSRLSARFTRRVDMGPVTFLPEMNVGWSHQYFSGDDALDTRFSAGGDPFTIRTADSSPDALVMGAGLSALMGRDASVYVQYQGQFARGGEAHHVSGGISFRF